MSSTVGEAAMQFVENTGIKLTALDMAGPRRWVFAGNGSMLSYVSSANRYKHDHAGPWLDQYPKC